MSDDVVYVPRVLNYNDDEPLGVDGTVVAVLSSSRSSRRITVLVEESASRHDNGGASYAPERVELEQMGYRDLQTLAGDLGIKANQTEDDLINDILGHYE